MKLSPPGPAAIPGWALTQKQQRQGVARGRISTRKQSKGWGKKQSWACWCLSFSANSDQKSLLWFRHTQCQPPPSHSHLVPVIYVIFANGTGLTPNFTFKPKVSLMHMVGGMGKGTASQFRFLMEQHSLKRGAKAQKEYQSLHSVCWARGKPKLKTYFKLRTIQATALSKLTALLSPSQSWAVTQIWCFGQKARSVIPKVYRKQHNFERNSLVFFWKRQNLHFNSLVLLIQWLGTYFYSRELLNNTE